MALHALSSASTIIISGALCNIAHILMLIEVDIIIYGIFFLNSTSTIKSVQNLNLGAFYWLGLGSMAQILVKTWVPLWKKWEVWTSPWIFTHTKYKSQYQYVVGSETTVHCWYGTLIHTYVEEGSFWICSDLKWTASNVDKEIKLKFPDIAIHAVCRDTEVFPFKPCILLVYYKEEEDDAEEEVNINYRLSTKEPQQRMFVAIL